MKGGKNVQGGQNVKGGQGGQMKLVPLNVFSFNSLSPVL